MSDHLDPHELELMSLFDRDLSPVDRDRLFELLNKHPELSEKYAFYLHLQDLSLGQLPPSNPAIKSKLMKHAARQTRVIRMKAWWQTLTTRLTHPAIAGPAALCLVFLIGYEVFDTQEPQSQSLMDLQIEESGNADERSVAEPTGSLVIAKQPAPNDEGADPKTMSKNATLGFKQTESKPKALAPAPMREPGGTDTPGISRRESTTSKKKARKSIAPKTKTRPKRMGKKKRQRELSRRKKSIGEAIVVSKPQDQMPQTGLRATRPNEMNAKTAAIAPPTTAQEPAARGGLTGASVGAKSRPDILYMGPATDGDEFETNADEPVAGGPPTPTQAADEAMPRGDEEALSFREPDTANNPLSRTERRLLLTAKKDRNLKTNESKFLLRVARLALRAGDYENARKWTLWVIRRNDDQLKPALQLQRKLIQLERP